MPADPARHFRTCTLCEAMCGIVVETAGTRILAIRGDSDDAFSRGHICPKAVALKDLQEDADRLRRPLLRVGSEWREIGWREAFARAESALRSIQRRHGRAAVGIYVGNPTVHNSGAMLYVPRLIKALRTPNRYSATSVDQLPHMLVSWLMYGHQLLLPVPDVDRSDHLLIFGANPVASNGSLMTAPGIARRLRDLRARGGRLIVIDPRRSETAAIADQHHFIRPGTDALALLGMLHTIFRDDSVRPGRLGDSLVGLAAIRELVERFPPQRVAAATGIDAGAIVRLARDFVAAERPVCYGRIGVSTQEFGSLACWLINLLNILTGRLDAVGGAMFTRPAIDLVGRPGYMGRGNQGRWRSRVRGLPETAGELPAAALAEEIDTPGAGQIRALITVAGNPVLSTPNGTRLERALAGLDCLVAVDFYLNETSRHAHLILPPTTPLERDHYDLVFHVLAVRNTAKYSPALFAREAGARHDWQILNELAGRLAGDAWYERIRARARASAQRVLGPRRLLDLSLRTGPYGRGLRPFAGGLSLAVLERAVHGIDLGPLEPCLPQRLQTPDRMIQLAPQPLLADVERLESTLPGGEPRAAAGLQLIGRRHLASNNSWMHNYRRLVKGPERCTLLMHPDDARARAVRDGDRVLVRSPCGEVRVPLEVTDSIMPGVVSLPHGWGHDRPGTRLSIAHQHAGASINDLTDDSRLDAPSGTASFSATPVTVEAAPA